MELTDISPLLRKLLNRENLSTEEAQEALETIMQKDKSGYYYLAFLTAVSTKGETSDELFGFYRAISGMAEKIKTGISSNNLIDLSGTGGAKLKTINVSTAASFVVAASGVKVAKQAFFGMTSPTGSADVFSALGIDVSKISPKEIIGTLDKVGIVPSYYQYFSPRLANRARLSREVYLQNGIAVRTPFHLIAFVFHPIEEMKRRIYGVFDPRFLPTLAELFQKAGYEKGMVFSGVDGVCEISTIGTTKVIEYNHKNQEAYEIEPEDLGLQKAKFDDIKAVNKEQNLVEFLKVLSGKASRQKQDIVVANAAAAFYALDKVSELKDGVELAQKMLTDGDAYKKLVQLVELIGDKSKLDLLAT